MESRYVSVPLKAHQLADYGGKVESEILEDNDGSQFADFKSNSSKDQLVKRKRGCESSKHSCSINPLKNYVNFMKGGLLSRLLYHQDGEWIDFPKEIIQLISEKFQTKQAAFEVEMWESRFMFDIMYMRMLDINTGMQKALAWFNDGGSCLYPDKCEECVETQSVCHYVAPQKCDANDINLHIRIELNGVKVDTVNENVIELQSSKKIRVENSISGYHSDSESRNDIETVDSGFAVGCNMNVVSFPNLNNGVDNTKVYEMFCMAMGSFSCPIVTEVRGFSSMFMANRLELFNMSVKHTEKLRGSSNVSYAWLPCTSKDISSIMSYGIGLGGLPSISAYGYGVHLSSKNHAYTSVKNCDDDENEVRHMLLCRVVLGNVEPVHLGSDQFHPSSDRFDTGVDNILEPRVYVVWEMNALSHIYPEYVVSFKLTPRCEVGSFVAQMESSENSRGAQISQGMHLGLSNASGLNYHPGKQIKYGSQGRSATLASSSPNIPSSPWMPFPVLFNAISKKVPSKTMQLVYHHYYLFKCKKSFSRSEFVKRVRMIVGDTLLKSTISALQSELRPPAQTYLTNFKVPKPEFDA